MPPYFPFSKILSSFSKSNLVKIRDFQAVDRILNNIRQRGSSHLQVIADFDNTLSRYHVDGQKCVSSGGILNRSPLMPPDLIKVFISLYEKYHPIEISTEISEEAKVPYMVEWYQAARRNMMMSGIRKDVIKKSVEISKLRLRDNAEDMFKMLHDAEVPVLIFSAGLGNTIEEILVKFGVFYSNLEIISNYIEFNERDGSLIGYRDLLVHPLNKNETVLPNANKYFMDLAHRNNAILLGDHLGDAQMSRGMPHVESILKIGFLNEEISNRLDIFMNTFDIVLIDDQSMDFVNDILRMLLYESAAAEKNQEPELQKVSVDN